MRNAVILAMQQRIRDKEAQERSEAASSRVRPADEHEEQGKPKMRRLCEVQPEATSTSGGSDTTMPCGAEGVSLKQCGKPSITSKRSPREGGWHVSKLKPIIQKRSNLRVRQFEFQPVGVNQAVCIVEILLEEFAKGNCMRLITS